MPLATAERGSSLTVTGNTVRVTNLTGHKLISGYPEGRRMWLNVQWFDAAGQLMARFHQVWIVLGPRPVAAAPVAETASA